MSMMLSKERIKMSCEFPINKVRSDFPILKRVINGNSLIYLDSGATTQKPKSVIDVINKYYSNSNSNVHRGVYPLAEEASTIYEKARIRIANFFNARTEKEIVFTKGATEGINLVAYSYVAPIIQKGDEILISHMEHHANIVPWQILCEQTGAILKIIPVTSEGELDLSNIDQLLNKKTRFLSITHVSNVLGTINPVKELIEKAHKKNIAVLIDGSQAVARMNVDFIDLDADFYVMSGHKLYGPTGIGVLYGKEEFLEKMRPYQTGGDMILRVTLDKTIFNDIPHKFEAGTPNIAGAAGIKAAIDYIDDIGMEKIFYHEQCILEYACDKLNKLTGFKRIGDPQKSAAILSFTLGDAHPHDIAHELGIKNICCRAGHHCAQPLMQHYGIPSTTRVSFGIHSTKQEVDALAEALIPIERKFRL